MYMSMSMSMSPPPVLRIADVTYALRYAVADKVLWVHYATTMAQTTSWNTDGGGRVCLFVFLFGFRARRSAHVYPFKFKSGRASRPIAAEHATGHQPKTGHATERCGNTGP